MSNSPFPQYPNYTLSKADIIAYLTPYLEKGWEIYQGNIDNQFIVRLLENLKLFIEFKENKWRISTGLDIDKSIAIWGYPENLAELDTAIRKGVELSTGSQETKIAWDSLPKTVRLNKEEPASNLSRLVSLINSSTIESVFDAYLDNKGLETLLNMATLGVSISSNIRLLTSTNMVNSSPGKTARLTPSYIKSWYEQLGCIHTEVRHYSYTGHQRRFMLLSGSQSLIVGPSLNNLSVNEASHLEPDTSDKSFFNSEWAKAQPLII